MEKEVLAPLFAGLIILTLAVLIKYFKMYWLIAGYNTSSKEDKEKTNIDGFARLMGNVFLLLGTSLLVLFLLRYFELLKGRITGIIIVILVLASVFYLLLQSRKFRKG